ncbi:MAG: fumarylacetoacetate hydrolase family protein [Sphingobium sp.]
MKLCRFNDSRLGLVEGDLVYDVTGATRTLPSISWPAPAGDLLIEYLEAIQHEALTLKRQAQSYRVDEVRFLSPVANPSKVIAAPVNYLKHQAEANADGGKNFATNVQTIDTYGLFLKANSSVVGTGEGVQIAFPDRRTDHEAELVVVIGKGGQGISCEAALSHVAGYTLGLDMTIRGSEDRSLRKSLDTFSVVGPWLVTPDEVGDPNNLDMVLTVNGNPRQKANTRDLIFNVQKLISYASSFYTLNPGDLLFTGTPEGVGPVEPGDCISLGIERIGQADILVRAAR